MIISSVMKSSLLDNVMNNKASGKPIRLIFRVECVSMKLLQHSSLIYLVLFYSNRPRSSQFLSPFKTLKVGLHLPIERVASLILTFSQLFYNIELISAGFVTQNSFITGFKCRILANLCQFTIVVCSSVLSLALIVSERQSNNEH